MGADDLAPTLSDGCSGSGSTLADCTSGRPWQEPFGTAPLGLAHLRSDAGVRQGTIAIVAVFYVVAGLFVAIIIMALPRFRTATHDKFEFTHRFFGWASPLLVSGNTVRSWLANGETRASLRPC